jgi:hypothetical protein
MKRILPLALIVAAACDPRPARFADAPAVEAVADDKPIPAPRPYEPVPEWRLSEAYLRRPLVNALDPARVPEGGDVNALDEVPRSSWFSAASGAPLCDADDLPALPLHPLEVPASSRAGALRVSDAAGRFFEIWRDPVDRPEMSTAAAAAASRIVRALGWYTPGVWVGDVAWSDFDLRTSADHDAMHALFKAGPKPVNGRYRAGFVRWPIGVDLGPTHAFDRRVGDGNDRVAHLDRRTLRALAVVFEWLGVGRLGAGVLRDAYVGAPGAGHVVHFIVDLGGALGADDVRRPEKPRDDDTDLAGRNIWVTMGTLGLYTPNVVPTQQRWPSIGEYGVLLDPPPFRTGPPFEPMDRLLPSDAYWIAKRIAALPAELIAAALDTGRMSDASARARLGEIVQARRLAVVARAFAGVTPIEVDRVASGTVLLRDEAVQRGFASAAASRYRVDIVDDRGERLFRAEVAPGGPRFAVPMPARAPDYAVLRITAVRDGKDAPRPMEAHLRRRAGGWALAGVRH